MSHPGRRRGIARATAVTNTMIMFATITGCTGEPVVPASTLPPSAGPTRVAEDPASPRPIRNDLAKGTAQHGFTSGPLRITVDYTADVPVQDWAANGPKPIRVSRTVYDNDKPGQRIYVTRTTTGDIWSAFDIPLLRCAGDHRADQHC